jgi:hypothetical protein
MRVCDEDEVGLGEVGEEPAAFGIDRVAVERDVAATSAATRRGHGVGLPVLSLSHCLSLSLSEMV